MRNLSSCQGFARHAPAILRTAWYSCQSKQSWKVLKNVSKIGWQRLTVLEPYRLVYRTKYNENVVTPCKRTAIPVHENYILHENRENIWIMTSYIGEIRTSIPLLLSSPSWSLMHVPLLSVPFVFPFILGIHNMGRVSMTEILMRPFPLFIVKFNKYNFILSESCSRVFIQWQVSVFTLHALDLFLWKQKTKQKNK